MIHLRSNIKLQTQEIYHKINICFSCIKLISKNNFLVLLCIEDHGVLLIFKLNDLNLLFYFNTTFNFLNPHQIPLIYNFKFII